MTLSEILMKHTTICLLTAFFFLPLSTTNVKRKIELPTSRDEANTNTTKCSLRLINARLWLAYGLMF